MMHASAETMAQPSQPDGHLRPEEIANYLSGTPDPARERAEAHLRACDECRRELIKVNRLVQAHRRRRRRLIVVPLAAAAVLALMLVPRPQDQEDATRRVRAGGEGGQRIEAVRPVDGASVSSDSITFTWRPATEGAQYALQITDTAGDIVLSQSTADTTLMVAARLLRPGQTYIWYLDALLPNGESATTGLRRFTIPP